MLADWLVQRSAKRTDVSALQGTVRLDYVGEPSAVQASRRAVATTVSLTERQVPPKQSGSGSASTTGPAKSFARGVASGNWCAQIVAKHSLFAGPEWLPVPNRTHSGDSVYADCYDFTSTVSGEVRRLQGHASCGS